MEGSPDMNNMNMNVDMVQPMPSAPYADMQMQPMQLQQMPMQQMPMQQMQQMPVKISCTPGSVYMIIGCILACIFSVIIVRQKFSDPTSIALTLLTPGWTLSYLCSQICCFLCGLCIVNLIIKTLCKNNNQSIGWGLAGVCICLQCVSIGYMAMS